MEALSALAVAARDIRALSTARADSRPRSDSPASHHTRLALPVRQGDVCRVGYRPFIVETACATYFVPGGLKGRGPLALV
jgi:hypothetical protein